MKRPVLACILGLSLVAAGCTRTTDDTVAEPGGTAVTDDRSRLDTAGTQQTDTAGTAGRDDTELPDGASPLALAGLIGMLSIAGAAGLRMLRR